jgi:hypothetical protein
MACLLTIAIEESMNANATTLDAENTITSRAPAAGCWRRASR